jgi:hypothetical protein
MALCGEGIIKIAISPIVVRIIFYFQLKNITGKILAMASAKNNVLCYGNYKKIS